MGLGGMGSLPHLLRRFGVPQAALLLVLAVVTRSDTSTVSGSCLARTRLPPHARALCHLRLRGGDDSVDSFQDEKGEHVSHDDAAMGGADGWGTER